MRNRPFRAIVAVFLATALLWTSGGAEAATFLSAPPPVQSTLCPRVILSPVEPAYFTEQAMVEQLISPRLLLSQRFTPAKEALGRLFLTYVEPVHRWSAKPIHKSLPKVQRGYVAAAVLSLLLSALHPWLALHTLILKACGNFVVIIKVKDSNLQIDLNNIDKTLEPGIRELVNRGVYSFGFSFQIPVLRKIPVESQLPGFKEDREVIVWEFQVGKVLLGKHDQATLEVAKREIKQQIKEGLPRAAYTPEYLLLSFHSRLGSVGTHDETLQQLEEAAQPGLAPPRGAPEDFEIRFEPIMETDQGFFNSLPPDYRMHVNIPGLGGVETTGAPAEVLSGQVKSKLHMGWRYVKADFQYQMNGDLSGIKGMNRNAPQEDIGNQEARERLTCWFGYGKPTGSLASRILKILVYSFTFWKPDGSVSPGDAPIQAMYFKMNYALRMPFAAIRYALFTHSLSPDDARYKTPSAQLMATTNLFVAHAFRYWSQDEPEVARQWFMQPTSHAEAEAAVQAKMRQAEDFAVYLRLLLTPAITGLKARHDFLNDPGVGNAVTEAQLQSIVQQFKPADLDAFLRETSLAFWRNGIQYATLREIKPRVEDKGTQAADYNTVIEPTVRIETANGQSLVGAVGPQNAAVASDRVVVLAAGDSLGLEKMLKIDSSANESADWQIKPEGVRVSVYRGVNNTPIPSQDVQNKRLSSIKDRDNPEEPLNDLPPLQGMEAGVRRSAIQMAHVHQSWMHVRQGYKKATNRIPITELTRVRMQLPIYEILMTQLFKKGLPIKEMDSWAWEQAGVLSRAVWEKPKRADDLLKDINALVDEQAKTRTPTGSSEYVDLKSMLPKYDAVYSATGKTYLALKKSAQSLNRTLGANILVLEGGELLKIVNKYSRRDPVTGKPKLDVDGLLRELGVNRHVPWVLASDSGAETYEINILSAVAKVVTEEPFGISGTSRNHLVDQFGPNRVLTTENYGSKDQDSTAAFLSMIQTLKEADLWATENITRRFKTGGPHWKDNPFFKTEFQHEEVAQLLIPTNDQVIQDAPARILGYTANGVALDTTPRRGNDAANIRQAGLRNAERDLEGARLWLTVKAYVITTVAGAAIGLAGLGHYLPRWVSPPMWAMNALDHLGWAGQTISGIWMVLPKIFTSGGPFIDATIYAGMALGLLFLKRAVFLRMGWSNTKVLEGWGLPTTLFVSSEDWMSEALADQGWVGEGLAYIMLKSTYLSSNLTEVNDKYRAAGNRNTQAIIFRPGSDHEAFEFDDMSADQAGRHLKTQVSMPFPHAFKWLAKFLRLRPVSPKVIHAGMHSAPAPGDNWGLMARTVDETIGKLPLVVPPGKKFAELPYHVAEYYLEQEVNLALYLQGVRRQATRADKRAKGVLGFFKYRAGVYLGGYAVKSTKAPSPGEKPLSAAERAALEMPLRMVAIVDHSEPRPKTLEHPAIETAPAEWHAWPQSAEWLKHGEESREFEQPWREVTVQPTSLSFEAMPETRTERSEAYIPEPALRASKPQQIALEPVVVSERELERVLVPLKHLAFQLQDEESPDGTSLIMKHTSLPSNGVHWHSTLRFNPEGQILEQEGRVPTVIPDLLARAVQRTDFAAGFQEHGETRNFLLDIDAIRDRTARYQAVSVEKNSEIAGVVQLDAHLMDDAEKGLSGARTAAMLELSEELLHGKHVFEETWAPPQTQSPHPRSREQLEVLMTGMKVIVFLQEQPAEREAVIDYWKTHSHYDPAEYNFAVNVLEPAHEAALRAQSDGFDLRQAIDLAVNVIKKPLRNYVKYALTARPPAGSIRPLATPDELGPVSSRDVIPNTKSSLFSRWRWAVWGIILTVLVSQSGGMPPPVVATLTQSLATAAGSLAGHASGASAAIAGAALQTAAAPAVQAALAGSGSPIISVATEAAKTATRHVIGFAPGDKTLGHFVLRLQKEGDPALKKFLKGDLWSGRDGGAVQRFWDKYGAQSNSGDMDVVSMNDKFSISDSDFSSAAAPNSLPNASASTVVQPHMPTPASSVTTPNAPAVPDHWWTTALNYFHHMSGWEQAAVVVVAVLLLAAVAYGLGRLWKSRRQRRTSRPWGKIAAVVAVLGALTYIVIHPFSPRNKVTGPEKTHVEKTVQAPGPVPSVTPQAPRTTPAPVPHDTRAAAKPKHSRVKKTVTPPTQVAPPVGPVEAPKPTVPAETTPPPVQQTPAPQPGQDRPVQDDRQVIVRSWKKIAADVEDAFSRETNPKNAFATTAQDVADHSEPFVSFSLGYMQQKGFGRGFGIGLNSKQFPWQRNPLKAIQKKQDQNKAALTDAVERARRLNEAWKAYTTVAQNPGQPEAVQSLGDLQRLILAAGDYLEIPPGFRLELDAESQQMAQTGVPEEVVTAQANVAALEFERELFDVEEGLRGYYISDVRKIWPAKGGPKVTAVPIGDFGHWVDVVLGWFHYPKFGWTHSLERLERARLNFLAARKNSLTAAGKNQVSADKVMELYAKNYARVSETSLTALRTFVAEESPRHHEFRETQDLIGKFIDTLTGLLTLPSQPVEAKVVDNPAASQAEVSNHPKVTWTKPTASKQRGKSLGNGDPTVTTIADDDTTVSPVGVNVDYLFNGQRFNTRQALFVAAAKKAEELETVLKDKGYDPAIVHQFIVARYEAAIAENQLNETDVHKLGVAFTAQKSREMEFYFFSITNLEKDAGNGIKGLFKGVSGHRGSKRLSPAQQVAAVIAQLVVRDAHLSEDQATSIYNELLEKTPKRQQKALQKALKEPVPQEPRDVVLAQMLVKQLQAKKVPLITVFDFSASPYTSWTTTRTDPVVVARGMVGTVTWDRAGSAKAKEERKTNIKNAEKFVLETQRRSALQANLEAEQQWTLSSDLQRYTAIEEQLAKASPGKESEEARKKLAEAKQKIRVLAASRGWVLNENRTPLPPYSGNANTVVQSLDVRGLADAVAKNTKLPSDEPSAGEGGLLGKISGNAYYTHPGFMVGGAVWTDSKSLIPDPRLKGAEERKAEAGKIKNAAADQHARRLIASTIHNLFDQKQALSKAFEEARLRYDKAVDAVSESSAKGANDSSFLGALTALEDATTKLNEAESALEGNTRDLRFYFEDLPAGHPSYTLQPLETIRREPKINTPVTPAIQGDKVNNDYYPSFFSGAPMGILFAVGLQPGGGLHWPGMAAVLLMIVPLVLAWASRNKPLAPIDLTPHGMRFSKNLGSAA